jgi:DNA polymerase-3 subunit epsilon
MSRKVEEGCDIAALGIFRLVKFNECQTSNVDSNIKQLGIIMGFFNKLLNAVNGTKTFSNSFIVFDVETTGLDRQNDRIIELAFVEMSATGEVARWSTLINPEGPVYKSEIHGITDSDVADAPIFKDISGKIVEFISGKTLVAHNAVFDLAFLRSEMTRAGWKIPYLNAICTLEASNYYLPDLGRRKLKDCCDAVGIKINDQHRAFGDVIATSELMKYYLDNNKFPTPRDIDLDKIIQGSPTDFKFDPNGIAAKTMARKIKLNAKPVNINSALSELIKILEKVDLQKLIGLELKSGYSSYLEKLVQFLEDSILSPDETAELAELRRLYELTEVQIAEIHGALITGVALQVLADETVSANERAEIKQLCALLGFKDEDSAAFIKTAKAIKNEQLSSKTKELPEVWTLGQPLRIGDRVVFTGCEPDWREKIESKTKKAGITVSSGVTKKTNMLVTDGSYVGNKAKDAQELGIRVVTPEQYEILLEFRQPTIS